jgi:hypothetical protein
MNEDARPAGTVDGMTAIVDDEPLTAGAAADPAGLATAAEPEPKVKCRCGAEVEPTRPGGQRPRPHLRPDTQQPCRIVYPTETVCKRCGGRPRRPRNNCTSHMFHPQTWEVAVRGEHGVEMVKVGNAAAAGDILGLSGEYFAYICRRYPSGHPSRPPEPIGHDLGRRTNYWRLDQVKAFRTHRPGKGAGPAPTPPRS